MFLSWCQVVSVKINNYIINYYQIILSDCCSWLSNLRQLNYSPSRFSVEIEPVHWWTLNIFFVMFTGTMATVWDIYDSFCDQNKTLENEKTDYPDGTVKTSKCPESSNSTVGTGNSTWDNTDSIHVQCSVLGTWDWRRLRINKCVCSEAIHSSGS